jgi:hypothetical protein
MIPAPLTEIGEMFAEYVGLTPEAAALIEAFRHSRTETKMDIIVRELTGISRPENPSPPLSRGAVSGDPPLVSAEQGGEIDLGQGVKLRVGETLYLFLSVEKKRAGKPDAKAVLCREGLELDGRLVRPSKGGNALQPAMRIVQERIGHRNPHGDFVSLSAWRQWHVWRDERLVPIDKLKDPKLARRRGAMIPLEDLEPL